MVFPQKEKEEEKSAGEVEAGMKEQSPTKGKSSRGRREEKEEFEILSPYLWEQERKQAKASQ